MAGRTDCVTRTIAAPAQRLYAAFAQPGALERWIAPAGMLAEMLEFDFRAGGCYRMRLRYRQPPLGQGQGKTSADMDEVEVRITRLEPDRLIAQEARFDSPDPAFAGVMRLSWMFEERGGATLVTVRAEDVPAGIARADHEAGINSSLDNLAAFVGAPG